MNGRIEHDTKIYKEIEQNLRFYPDFVARWYYNLKANKKTATTCRDFMTKMRKFLVSINPQVRQIQISDITSEKIVDYFISIQYKANGKETSDSYKQGVWTCLNNFSEYLEDMELIDKNLLKQAHVKKPTNKDLMRINQERKYLTKDDFKKIIDCVKSGTGTGKTLKYQEKYRYRDLCIMTLFLTTGMRCAALQSINLEDVDVKSKTLIIVDKGHIYHEYPLSDEFIIYYNKWVFDRFFLLKGKKVDALFISRTRERISTDGIADLVDKYAREALGYHISPHKLRGGFVSIMYNETHDIEFTRRVVGHANIATTQRYISTDNSERNKALDIMKNII